MVIYAIAEPSFQKTLWYNEICSAIEKKATSRHDTCCFYQGVGQLPKMEPETPVILIGATQEWMIQESRLILYRGLRPIIASNHFFEMLRSDCSHVTVDVEHSVELLCNAFIKCGRSNPAIYGVNPHSSSDTGRCNAFLKHFKQGGIYYNKTSLDKCFQSFYPDFEQYDSILCVNSYSAVSLINHFKQSGIDYNRFIIASCHYSQILSHFPNVIAARFSWADLGKAAVDVWVLLQKHRYLLSLCAFVPVALNTPEALADQVPSMAEPQAGKIDENRFYNDQTYLEMARLDLLLSRCDEVDHYIIAMLKKGYVYSKIGEQCYISENAVKYRIKNMRELLGCNTKSEMVALIQKYL